MAENNILSTAMENFHRASLMLKDEVEPDVLAKLSMPRERVEFMLTPYYPKSHPKCNRWI